MSNDKTKKLSEKELRELKPKELFSLYQEELNKEENDKDIEYTNTIFGIFQEINNMFINESKIVQYFTKTKEDEIKIDYTKDLLKVDNPTAEDYIATLIQKGKVSEEKAFYALSMQKVASIFSTFKKDFQDTKSSLEEMKSTLEEIKNNSANNAEINALQEKITEKERKLEETNKNMDSLKEDLEEIKSKLESVTSEKNELEVANKSFQRDEEEFNNIKEENEKLKESNSKLRENYGESTDKLNAQKEHIEKINSILEEALNIDSENLTIESLRKAIEEQAPIKTIESKPDLSEYISIAEHENRIEEEQNSREAVEMSLKKAKEELITLKEKIEELSLNQNQDEPNQSVNKKPKEDSQEENIEAVKVKRFNFKPNKKAVKITLASSLIIALAFGFINQGSNLIPSDFKNKLETIFNEDTQSSNQENLAFEELALEELEVKEKEAASTPKKEEETVAQIQSNDVFSSQEIIDTNSAEEETDTTPTNQEVEEVNNINSTISVPAEIEPEPRVTNKERLKQIQSSFKVTPNNMLNYKNNSYKKGDVIEGFKIAYITSNFIIFVDKDDSSKIHKIIL